MRKRKITNNQIKHPNTMSPIRVENPKHKFKVNKYFNTVIIERRF